MNLKFEIQWSFCVIWNSAVFSEKLIFKQISEHISKFFYSHEETTPDFCFYLLSKSTTFSILELSLPNFLQLSLKMNNVVMLRLWILHGNVLKLNMILVEKKVEPVVLNFETYREIFWFWTNQFYWIFEYL